MSLFYAAIIVQNLLRKQSKCVKFANRDARYPTKITLLGNRVKDMQNSVESALAHNAKIPQAISDLTQSTKELGNLIL